MEEKKQIKISLKTFIILISIFIVFIGICIYIPIRYYSKEIISSYTNGKSTTVYSNSKIESNGKKVDYTIEVGYYYGTADCKENAFITSYAELEEYLDNFGEITIDNENVLEHFQEDFFKKHTIAIEAHDATFSNNSYEIDSVKVDKNEANINIKQTTTSYGGVFPKSIQFTFISLDKNIQSVRFNIVTKNADNPSKVDIIAYKPIIYLYPCQNTEVSVKVGYKDNITVSYPKYINGWNVLAKKDGTLTDLKTGRNLYSLYYENKNKISFDIEKEGFVVKKSDTIQFLEEKLEVLGITEREAEEFIIYWLPKLQSNEYNYIRFATENEINANMPLEINPNPDTIIRVLMTFKGLEKPIKVQEQSLIKPERKGFVVVEWGATEIN